MTTGTLSLMLCGDVMTGRGIDQVLPHPSEATLYEPFVKSAIEYVRIAERANGPIRAPVPFEYVWGDALEALAERQPDVRIINLETAVTRSDRPNSEGLAPSRQASTSFIALGSTLMHATRKILY